MKPPKPQEVSPQPVPMSISVNGAKGPAGDFVVLQIQTPIGIAVYFLDVETARGLGAMLKDAASPVSIIKSLADVGIGKA